MGSPEGGSGFICRQSNCRKVAVAFIVKELLLCGYARGYHPHDFALDDLAAFDLARIFNLFTDRHPVPCLDKLGQV